MLQKGTRFNPFKMFTGSFMPEAIESHRELTSTSKIVYARLLRYAGRDGKAFPKQSTLADSIGANEKTVQRSIKQLRELGFIEVEKGNRLTHAPNAYHFIFNDAFAEAAETEFPKEHLLGAGEGHFAPSFKKEEEDHIKENHIEEESSSRGPKDIQELEKGIDLKIAQLLDKINRTTNLKNTGWRNRFQSDIRQLAIEKFGGDLHRILIALQWVQENGYGKTIDGVKTVGWYLLDIEKQIENQPKELVMPTDHDIPRPDAPPPSNPYIPIPAEEMERRREESARMMREAGI